MTADLGISFLCTRAIAQADPAKNGIRPVLSFDCQNSLLQPFLSLHTGAVRKQVQLKPGVLLASDIIDREKDPPDLQLRPCDPLMRDTAAGMICFE